MRCAEHEIAHTPEPPYYAVIFTSVRTPGDHGYAAMAEESVRSTCAVGSGWHSERI
jgi:hypothetical protein